MVMDHLAIRLEFHHSQKRMGQLYNWSSHKCSSGLSMCRSERRNPLKEIQLLFGNQFRRKKYFHLSHIAILVEDGISPRHFFLSFLQAKTKSSHYYWSTASWFLPCGLNYKNERFVAVFNRSDYSTLLVSMQ